VIEGHCVEKKVRDLTYSKTRAKDSDVSFWLKADIIRLSENVRISARNPESPAVTN
jgi:hypothetical protein